MFGYPEWYEIPTKEYDAFDLLGNTVAIPVVEFVVSKVAEGYNSPNNHKSVILPMDNSRLALLQEH